MLDNNNYGNKLSQKSRAIGVLWRIIGKSLLRRSYLVKICSIPDGGNRRASVKTLAWIPD